MLGGSVLLAQYCPCDDVTLRHTINKYGMYFNTTLDTLPQLSLGRMTVLSEYLLVLNFHCVKYSFNDIIFY